MSSGTIFDNFKGFVTLVGGRDSFPLTGRQSFLLKPGQESYVAITATSVISDEAVRDIEPGKRNCFFHDEHPLKLHRNYSQANCMFQCQADYARSQMESKCIPWYLPGKTLKMFLSFTICVNSELKFFQLWMNIWRCVILGKPKTSLDISKLYPTTIVTIAYPTVFPPSTIRKSVPRLSLIAITPTLVPHPCVNSL